MSRDAADLESAPRSAPDGRARVYFFFSILEEFFGRVAAEMVRQGDAGEVSGCIWGRRSKPVLQKLGIGTDGLLMLSDVYRNLPEAPDYDYLRSWEDCAQPLTAPLMVTADRVVCSKPYTLGMAHVEAALRAVESAFDRFRPTALVMDDVSCIPSYAHFLAARRRNLPVYIFGPSRLPGRTTIYSNPYAIFEDANAAYRQIRSAGLAETERAAVRGYIADLRSSGAPAYMKYMGRKPGMRWGEWRTLARLWHWSRQDRMDYTVVPPLRAIGNRLTRIARSQLYRPMWEQPVPGEPYVVFPLHYQPEASTSVRAPFVMDQCTLAENIARALPAGYRLYVKEHTARLGNRPLRDFRRLREIPAVRLIHPAVDSRQLMEHAACVATITGTMGWEALLAGVPVVVFGRVFYEACENVRRAEAPLDYPKVFREALSMSPRPEATEDFVAALLRTTFPGAHGHPYYLPQVLAAENIRTIASQLGRRISTSVGANA